MKLKKILSAVLSLSIASAFMLPSAVYAAELGDVDGNGTVDSYDALLILQYAVGDTSLSDAQLKSADMNSDGDVNSYDALLVLQKTVSSDYSSFTGNYKGLFGEDKTTSYTAYGTTNKNQRLEISSFTMSITSLDGERPEGSITLQAGLNSFIMTLGEMNTVEFNNGILHLSHKGTSAEIDMDIDFNSTIPSGKINKAKILATQYDFPCTIYFEKNQ